MSVTIKLSDIIDELDMMSSEMQSYLNIKTGNIVTISDFLGSLHRVGFFLFSFFLYFVLTIFLHSARSSNNLKRSCFILNRSLLV